MGNTTSCIYSLISQEVLNWLSVRAPLVEHPMLKSVGSPYRRNHNITWHMIISFSIMLSCNRFIQLRLNYLLEYASCLYDAVQIKAEWTMHKVPIGLFDAAFLEIVACFDITFVLPLRSRFLKTGM